MEGRTEVLRDVPTAEKKDTDDDFWASGATSVTWTKQSNGLWTVAASFPPSGGSGGAGGSRPR